jgi:hypothetical protein
MAAASTTSEPKFTSAYLYSILKVDKAALDRAYAELLARVENEMSSAHDEKYKPRFKRLAGTWDELSKFVGYQLRLSHDSNCGVIEGSICYDEEQNLRMTAEAVALMVEEKDIEDGKRKEFRSEDFHRLKAFCPTPPEERKTDKDYGLRVLAARLGEAALQKPCEELDKMLKGVAEADVQGYCRALVRILHPNDKRAFFVLLYGAKEADICRILKFVQVLSKEQETRIFNFLAVGPHDGPAGEGAVADLAMGTVADPAVGPAPNTLGYLAQQRKWPVFCLPSHPPSGLIKWLRSKLPI